VGVVRDVLHGGLDAEVVPELFVSHMNLPLRDTHLVVRAAEGADLGTLIPRVRQTIRALDPGLPINRVAAMEELVADSLARPRFNMALLLGFASCALLLAGIGIYGVVAYSVAQRSTEIGIRMALGSDAGHTFRLVVGQTLAFVGLGAVVGIVAAVALSRLVGSLLFGVGPLDPVTLAAVVGVLGAVAGLAAAIPARWAVRISPARALESQ